MSLLRFKGISDAALANEMTVFLDPLKTDSRHQPGVSGVAVSLMILSCVSDWMTICSILGDMAMCIDIDCRDIPNEDSFDLRSVESLIDELEEAVGFNDEDFVLPLFDDPEEAFEFIDEDVVCSLLREILEAAGLLEDSIQLALSA